MSETKDEKSIVNKPLSRRSVLKWSGALAAAGIVGIGLGIGGDLLIRPSVTKTTTSTSLGTKTQTATTTATQTATTTATQTATTTATQTATVTTTPPTLSYVPPLSPSVQENVNTIIQNLVNRHAGETVFYHSACDFNHVKVHANNGQIAAIEMDDMINPNMPMEDKYISEDAILNGLIQWRAFGRELALQGIFNSPNLITYPMKRVSANRGTLTGQFVRITWQEALDTVAAEMQSCQATYGAYSIFNNPVGPWQGCDVEYWGDGSTEGGDWAQRIMYNNPGYEDADSSSFSSAFKSNLIVILGQESTNSGGGGLGTQMGWFFRLAHEKSIPIIVIDPSYNYAAQILADQYIAIRQGTDAAFLLAIANVLFTENLYDSDFVGKFVEPTGFQMFQDYVLGNTAGPDGAINRTPAWAEPITGIPADTIQAFAELYAKSKPVFWMTGTRVTNKTPYAHDAARLLITIAAMIGNIGVEGATDGLSSWDTFPGQNAYNLPPGWPTTAPVVENGLNYGTFYMPTAPCGYPGLLYFSHIADAILLRENLDSGQMTQTQYLNAIAANIYGPVPNIHMAFNAVDCASWVNTASNLNQRLEAVANLDFFVAMTCSMQSEAAQVADIILPQIMTSVYDGDFYPINQSAFTTYRNVMNYQPYVIQRLGESMPQSWICQQLANRLGFGKQYSPVYYTLGIDPPADQWDALNLSLDQQAYEAWAATSAVQKAYGQALPSWTDFLNQPWIEFPLSNPANSVSGTGTFAPIIPFTDQIQNGKPFATESGKIEIYNKFLANPSEATWNAMKPAGFYGMTIPYGWYLNAPISPMGMWEPYWTNFWTTDQMNNFPIILNSTHSVYRIYEWLDGNPFTGDSSTVQSDPVHSADCYGNSALKMSAIDAQARGIVDGDQVRIFNECGQVVLNAVVTSTVAPGYAWLTHGRYAVNNSSTDVDVYGNPLDVRGNENSLTYSNGNTPSPPCFFAFDTPVQVELFYGKTAATTTTS